MVDVEPQVGDILEWQGQPVLVLGDVRRPAHYGGVPTVLARVAYLRDLNTNIVAGRALPQFHIDGKDLWTDELSDDEVALAMRLILTDG